MGTPSAQPNQLNTQPIGGVNPNVQQTNTSTVGALGQNNGLGMLGQPSNGLGMLAPQSNSLGMLPQQNPMMPPPNFTTQSNLGQSPFAINQAPMLGQGASANPMPNWVGATSPMPSTLPPQINNAPVPSTGGLFGSIGNLTGNALNTMQNPASSMGANPRPVGGMSPLSTAQNPVGNRQDLRAKLEQAYGSYFNKP